MEKTGANKMGFAPMTGLIFSMSLPAMFSMLVQALYNVVDSYFVSHLGVEALAALSLAFPIQNLMIAIGAGTGVGINSLVSRRLGEGRHQEAGQAATHGLLLGVANGLFIALLGAVGTRPFFEVFTADPVIVQMGCDYGYIITIFSVGMFTQMCVEKTLQATGNMIMPMCSQLLGAITNIILDPIMIYGLLGFPAMGIRGAAVATVIGQILGGAFITTIALTRKHAVHISLKGFCLNGRTLRDIYAVGFPSIIMQSISSAMTMGVNAILVKFSDVAVAVFGIYFKLQSFVFMPVFGLTQGVMPIMGYNYGARNKKRLISSLKISSIIALAIMALGMVIFLIAPVKLLAIFQADHEMLQIGVPALRIIALCFVPAALGIMFSTIFQAVGMGGRSLFLSLLRQLILILPLSYVLASIGGLNYVWYAFPLAETFSFVGGILFYLDLYHRHIKNMTPAAVENAE